MRWYRSHGRHDLPWRLTRDPYAVLVSEVMLQQTQVDRVIPYFQDWMARWPTAAALADASPADVIRAWAGLGYNRRALNLHRAARRVVEDHAGAVPTDKDALQRLPGVGDYTASAVACFAGKRRTTVVDTNIGRVIARSRMGRTNMRVAGERATRDAAAALLPARSARDWNLALMDLGATVCSARRPNCGQCPVRDGCAWRLADFPADELTRATAVPFEETARFARGRIVAALRTHDVLATHELAERLPEPHCRRVERYLRDLERDGLIVCRAGTPESWSLPHH